VHRTGALRVRTSFILFLVFIYGSLFLGYLVKKAYRPIAGYSRFITLVLLTVLTPLIILNSFWSLALNSTKIIQLPLVFICLVAASALPAAAACRVLPMDRKEMGSFLSCTLFSNVGITLGGFLCYVLYGERGLYLSILFSAFFLPFYYLAGFPLMSYFSKNRKVSVLSAGAELLRNPASAVSLALTAAGIALNLSGIERPGALNTISTKWLTYISAGGFSFGIGLGLNFRESLKYVKHAFFISAVKFIFNPFMGFLCIVLFGYGGLSDRIPAQVIFIESFMPTAIFSLVLVKIFRLNEDLANSAWILTNLLAIPIIPPVVMIARFL
jgi:predicted permease